MFKRPHYIALILVVLFVAVLSRLPSQTVGNLKLAIGGMFLPLFGLASSSHNLVNQVGNTVVPRRELIRQNQEFRQANQEMYLSLKQNEVIWRENERLRQLVGWQRQKRWNIKLAHVVTRDPANWWRSVQIDLGDRDGIRTNLEVLTTDGLVGRVLSVGETRSQVVLLGDPNLRVAAMIETNREKGISLTASSSPQENNMVDLSFLPGNSGARPGQTVQTSGDGGVFRGGIAIGKIVDVRTKDYGLSTEARVKLSADLSTLEEVWVMMP